MIKGRPLIFVISAPSGGGKTTICRSIIKVCSGVELSISLTTRKKRDGEKKNFDYHFISQKEFLKKIKQNAFAEWATVLKNYYGTLKKNIEAPLKQGKDVILNIDVKGALQIKKIHPEAILIFILPPSLDVLKKRLVGRETDSRHEIKKRLNLAHKELSCVKNYDYAVINDSLRKAVKKVENIILAERCRVIKR